ncbi:fatty acid binding protein 1-B.1-like [Chanos chanos]|uniref:Fatty acid binding protein 1-B.1-like n=1 Tax=Chanos chanos TaxID=29144 RepID=A0A6J2ULC7_CHACN|nr:fatty acid binding protein 1-B.1-like [Chanos chanos]
MSFKGKYQVERQENLEAFMKLLGATDEMIEQFKDIKVITEVEENGDHFKMTDIMGSNVRVVAFTIGQESEVDGAGGEKVKVFATRQGNKVKLTMPTMECILEMTDKNTLVSTTTAGTVVHKRISKRI